MIWNLKTVEKKTISPKKEFLNLTLVPLSGVKEMSSWPQGKLATIGSNPLWKDTVQEECICSSDMSDVPTNSTKQIKWSKTPKI